ncbi:unnamed protein product, partial [Adineta steineri]
RFNAEKVVILHSKRRLWRFAIKREWATIAVPD